MQESTKMDEAERWMRQHEMILCKPLRAKITPRQCISNQKMAENDSKSMPFNQNILIHSCPDCEHGRLIKEGSNGDGTVNDKRERTAESTCKECGRAFKPYMNGNVLVRNTCFECLVDKRRGKRGVTHDDRIVVDFTDNPELLDYVRERAKKEFRPVPLQVLAIINEAMAG
jgi:hypothetical protein